MKDAPECSIKVPDFIYANKNKKIADYRNLQMSVSSEKKCQIIDSKLCKSKFSNPGEKYEKNIYNIFLIVLLYKY
jgi:hypothetical protein